MRYGIFSDVHANLEALEAVLDAYKKEVIDEFIYGGDIVGYGANPKECITRVKAIAKVTVAGNHDWASVDLFPTTYFNPLAAQAVSWTRQNLDTADEKYLKSLQLIFKNTDLTLVHGTLHNPQDFDYMLDGYAASQTFEILKTDICFVGHSHLPGFFIQDKDKRISYHEKDTLAIEKGKQYIVNVGSVGQPRDHNPDAAYCIYDTDKKKAQIKRIKYDIETARKKIINAGLPKFLGDRLLSGR
jgi:predicted phosphodiesterase